MKHYILNLLKIQKHVDIFPGIPRSNFVKKLYSIILILTSHKIKQGDVIALHAKKSIMWITIYIASLLKGCKLLVIPHIVKGNELIYYLNITNTKLLFTGNVSTYFEKIPFLEIVYMFNSRDNLRYLTGKKHHRNIAKTLEEIPEISDITLKDLHEILDDGKYNNKQTGIITPTSGTNELPKLVFVDSNALMNIIGKTWKIIPYHFNDTIFSNIDFSHSHIITILLPFVKTCTFVGSQEEANIVIEDNSSFKHMWRNKILTLLENKLIGTFLQKIYVRWLLVYLYKKRLYKHYLKNTKLKTLIIYNNTINRIPLEIIKSSKLPIFSTYGSQEMCQLIAWNDYSTKQLRKKGNIGNFIPGIEWLVNKDSHLLLLSKTMFKKYWDHPQYKKDLMLNKYELFNTLDNVIESFDTVFFKENKPNNLESILNSLPYVEDLHIFTNNNKTIIIVYPDIKMMDINHTSLKELENIIEHYKIHLDSILNKETKIILSSIPLIKTPDGKIKHYLYENIGN